MSDLEEEEQYFDSDSSDNEEQHSKFLSSVSQLDSTQRVKPASRKEVSTQISEYNLTTGITNKPLVHVNDLANVLKQKAKHVVISNKLKKVTGKARTLPKPLEKPAEERLKRTIGYHSVKNQVRRWNAVVERNSLRDQLTFPLNNTAMKLQDASDFLTQFQTPTPLEAEMTKVLKQENQSEKENATLEFPLTLKEIIQKRKEMAQMRARLSYKEVKAQRQNQIKSKKYHRIIKHQKVRQQLKEFELLQKTDPAKALEKLDELDKNRALERASLRHRNTGQWAKNLTVKAKYDVQSRKMLAEQLKISRQITKKVPIKDSSDEEESAPLDSNTNTNASQHFLSTSNDNPWALDVSEEVHHFLSGYKKYWTERNNQIVDNPSNTVPEDTSPPLKNLAVKTPDTSTNSPLMSTAQRELVPKKGISPTVDEEAFSSGSIRPSLEECDPASKEWKTKTKGKKLVKTPSPEVDANEAQGELNDSGLVTARPTSGVWVVTTVYDPPEALSQKERKRTAEGISQLFGDLSERLVAKAAKKTKKINKKLKREEEYEKRINVREAKKGSEPKLKLDLRGKNPTERPDMDISLLEGTTDENETYPVGDSREGENGTEAVVTPAEIDPEKFIKVRAKRLGCEVTEEASVLDEAIDDEVDANQRNMIEEAFGGDDVIAEFRKLKKEEQKKDEVNISTCLPGWGEWGGVGIIPSKRKKKLLTVAKLRPRKDKKKIDTVINEEENPNIKNHLVSSIPHPFKSAEAFESNIRAPIGREWIPERAHHRMIQKSIETKLGAIIDPMDEEEIIREKKSHKSPYQGKRKINK